MIHIEQETIRRAFRHYHERYVNVPRGWDINHRADLWQLAKTAFETCDAEVFAQLHDALAAHWQAFRGAQTRWSVSQIFKRLCGLDHTYRTRRLADLTNDDIPALWSLLQDVQDLKKNKSGLFVIE